MSFYRVRVTSLEGGAWRMLPLDQLFPESLRAILLLSYLHGVRWIAVPKAHRPTLQLAILHRLARRFCRLHPVGGDVAAWSLVQRVRPNRKKLRLRRRRSS